MIICIRFQIQHSQTDKNYLKILQQGLSSKYIVKFFISALDDVISNFNIKFIISLASLNIIFIYL